MDYKKYIKSEEWFSLKIDIIQIKGCFCGKCNKSLPPNKLQLHHITYKRLYNEKLSDLILLCGKCHMNEHGIENKIKKPSQSKKQNKKASFVKSVIKKIKDGKFKSEKSKLKAMKTAFAKENKIYKKEFL